MWDQVRPSKLDLARQKPSQNLAKFHTRSVWAQLGPIAYLQNQAWKTLGPIIAQWYLLAGLPKTADRPVKKASNDRTELLQQKAAPTKPQAHPTVPAVSVFVSVITTCAHAHFLRGHQATDSASGIWPLNSYAAYAEWLHTCLFGRNQSIFTHWGFLSYILQKRAIGTIALVLSSLE